MPRSKRIKVVSEATYRAMVVIANVPPKSGLPHRPLEPIWRRFAKPTVYDPGCVKSPRREKLIEQTSLRIAFRAMAISEGANPD